MVIFHMNRKGFANIVIIIGAVILIGVVGFFIVSQQTPSPIRIPSSTSNSTPIPTPSPLPSPTLTPTLIPRPTRLPASSIRTEKLETYFVVKEDEQIKVDALLIEVKNIVSLTGRGCLGGPVGCPDRVELSISFGSRSEKTIITLSVQGGTMQTVDSEKAIDKYRVKLTQVTEKTATIGVFENSIQ